MGSVYDPEVSLLVYLYLYFFCFAPLNGGDISSSSLSTKCEIYEYNPGTVAPIVTRGIAGLVDFIFI